MAHARIRLQLVKIHVVVKNSAISPEHEAEVANFPLGLLLCYT